MPEANIALEIGWLEDEIEKLGFAFVCFMGCTMEFINIIHHHLRDNNIFGICSKHRFVLINGQEGFYGFHSILIWSRDGSITSITQNPYTICKYIYIALINPYLTMGLAMIFFPLVLFVVGTKNAGKLSDSDHVMLSQVIRFLAFRAGFGLSLESLLDLQNMWKLREISNFSSDL